MVQALDKPRRRSSAGPGRRASERNILKSESSDAFDPFDGSNTESVMSVMDKKKDSGDHKKSFDPFAVDAKGEKSVEKKNVSAKVRRAMPSRSASVGTLSLSMADFASEKENKDDDMEFEEIDWDNGGDAAPQRSSKGRSRRHSMDSRPKGNKSDTDNDSVDDSFQQASKDGSADDKKKKKKVRSAKTRRQSLDSALSTTAPQDDDAEEDGFGPVKTFGFEQTVTVAAPSDRRKGLTRSKSGSSEMSMQSWKSNEEQSRAPKRVIHRRRSENPIRDSDGFSLKSHETETTASPDSEDE